MRRYVRSDMSAYSRFDETYEGTTHTDGHRITHRANMASRGKISTEKAMCVADSDRQR